MIHFSIITPTFNRADIILECLISSYRERQKSGLCIEHLIIDDGSTDDTERVVQTWHKENPDYSVHYVRLSKNQGVTAARNYGLAAAKGKYCILMDSDDQFLPNSLERIWKIFEGHPECDVYFGAIALKSRLPAQVLLTAHSPIPDAHLDPKVFDYSQFLNQIQLSEHLPVLKRSTYEKHDLKYVAELNGFESILYLRILRLGGKLIVDPYPVRLYDDLRDDRFCSPHKMQSHTQRLLNGFRYYLKEFENDLIQFAPVSYETILQRIILYSKLTGNRDPQVLSDIRHHLSHAGFKTRILEISPALFLKWAYFSLIKFRQTLSTWTTRKLRLS